MAIIWLSFAGLVIGSSKGFSEATKALSGGFNESIKTAKAAA